MMNMMILMIAGAVALLLVIIGFVILRKMVQNGRITERAATVLLFLMIVFVIAAGVVAFIFMPSTKSGLVPIKHRDQYTQEASAYNISEKIVGNWTTVIIDDTKSDGPVDSIDTYTYVFNDDGSFEFYPGGYMNLSKFPELNYSDGWDTQPVGYPGYYGTYTVIDNQTLKLNYDHGDYGIVLGYSTELIIQKFDADTVVFFETEPENVQNDIHSDKFFGSARAATFIKANGNDYRMVCDRLGITLSE